MQTSHRVLDSNESLTAHTPLSVAAHQPSYFPWLGWLHKCDQVDTFVLLDDVQLSDSAFQHRNLFLAESGEAKYLTLPFQKKQYLTKSIRDLRLAESEKWQAKHRDFLKHNYRRHPAFADVFAAIEPIFSNKYTFLVDALLDSIRASLHLFDVKTNVVLQSSLPRCADDDKNEMLIRLTRNARGTTYVSGSGAKSYLQVAAFNDHGLEVSFQEFRHPIYDQASSKGGQFVEGLSCLDALFNLGPEGAGRLLRNSCGGIA